MIRVESKVIVYEENSKRLEGEQKFKVHLLIRSHGTDRDLVVLELNGQSIAVNENDLHMAIANACNVGRW